MAGRIRGVLFDIDDTLVDLRTAMGSTLRHISPNLHRDLSDGQWTQYLRLFAGDPLGHYDRFLSGEVSFAEQRMHRIRHAHQRVNGNLLDEDTVLAWNKAYEKTLPLHFAAFDDVGSVLDALEAAGIAYGAVSNNVEAYQRAKLDAAELARVAVLVGTDTVNCPKPDPAIFLEGARQLGTDPGVTMYVGDNLTVDAEGARGAGLVGVWLNRPAAYGSGSETAPHFAGGPTISSLASILPLVGITDAPGSAGVPRTG